MAPDRYRLALRRYTNRHMKLSALVNCVRPAAVKKIYGRANCDVKRAYVAL
jgi:hypothetical protein